MLVSYLLILLLNPCKALLTLLIAIPSVNCTYYTLKKWHHSLEHLDIHTLKKMARHEIVDSLTISTNADLGVCKACGHGKQHWLPFLLNSERK